MEVRVKIFFGFVIFLSLISNCCGLQPNDLHGELLQDAQDTNTFGSRIARFLESLPRFGFNGGNISMKWDPTNFSYYKSIILLASPFFILGIFLFILIQCVLCCQCIKSPNPQQNTTSARICTMIFLFLTGGSLVSGVILSLMLQNNWVSTLTTVETLQEGVVADINNLNSVLQKLNATDFIPPDIERTLNLIASSSNYTEEFKFYAHQVGSIVEYSLISILGFGALICLLGLLSTLCSQRCLVLTTMIFGIIVLPFLWITASAMVPTAVFIADGCTAAETYAENRTNSDMKVWIPYYISCKGVNPLYKLEMKANSSLIEAENALNYTETHYPNNTQDINKLKTVIADIKEVQSILEDLSNCTKTSSYYMQARGYVCMNMLDDVTFIFLASCIGGLFLFSGLWSAIKYYVRMRAVVQYHNVTEFPPINQYHQITTYPANQYQPIYPHSSEIFSERIE